MTSIAPNAGALAGGIAVTITGTGFLTGAVPSFAGLNCTSVVVVSATSITCTTPANSQGAVAVNVTNLDGQIGSAASAFRYQAAPTVTSVSANAGALAGGTAVTITGMGFYAGSTVTFDGLTCTTPVVMTATSMTCITPAHSAGAVNVVVTNADTQTGTGLGVYTYQLAPTVTSITPNDGVIAGGTTITITGTNFLIGATAAIGGVNCSSLIVVSSTSITCTTSAHSIGVVAAAVTNADLQTGSLAGAFTYRDAPTVTSVSLNAGSLVGGTAVSITGTGFYTGSTVTFDGLTCITPVVVSSTSITCTTPAHITGAINVVVTNVDTQTGTGISLYTYQDAPTVTSIAPNAGALAGGTVITITGTGFLTGAVPSFAGVNCTTPVVVNSTTVTCITPVHSAGVVDVVVTNADTQTGIGLGVYTYQPAPTVTSITPNDGVVAGGTAITITGTNFIIGASSTIGGVNCSLLTVVSSTSITCTTSAHSIGVVTATVTNADLQTGSLAGAFTYRDAPTVTSVSLNAGSLVGGTAVSITGTGFYTGSTVTFDGVSCTTPVVVSATRMTCSTPAHIAGAVNVVVTNADTQAGTATNLYTYQAAPLSFTHISKSGTKIIKISQFFKTLAEFRLVF